MAEKEATIEQTTAGEAVEVEKKSPAKRAVKKPKAVKQLLLRSLVPK